jgi:hypothetical protein
MGRFANVVNAFIDGAAELQAIDEKATELTYKFMSKTQGVDFDQAKAIATVLVTQADVTWK